MPSFWKLGGIRMSVTTTWGFMAIRALDQLVVVRGDAHDLEIGLEVQERAHAFTHEDVVVGEEDRDAPDCHDSIRPQSGRPGKGASPATARGLAPRWQVGRVRLGGSKAALIEVGPMIARPQNQPRAETPYAGPMASKSKPAGESKKPGRSLKEKRAAKHQKQAENRSRAARAGKRNSRRTGHCDRSPRRRARRQLGTVGPTGEVRLVPICFALDGERIVSAVDHKPKTTTALARLADIERAGRATLLVDHYDDADWSPCGGYESPGPPPCTPRPIPLAAVAVSRLAEKYPQYRQSPPAGPTYSIAIEHLTWWSATP